MHFLSWSKSQLNVFLVCRRRGGRKPLKDLGMHEYKDREAECTQTCRWHGSVRLSQSAAEKHNPPVNHWRHARHISGHTQRPFLTATTRKVQPNHKLITHFPVCRAAVPVYTVWIHFSFTSIPLEVKLFAGLFWNSFTRITSCLYRYGF